MKYVNEDCSDCKYCKEYEHTYLRCTHTHWYACKYHNLYWPKETKNDK